MVLVPDVFALSVSNPGESRPPPLPPLLPVGNVSIPNAYVRLRRGRRAGLSKRPIDPPLMAFDPSPLAKAEADGSPADLLGKVFPTITVGHCCSIILKNATPPPPILHFIFPQLVERGRGGGGSVQ